MARTLEELAVLSGVSRATVSRVINGGSVSEQSRQKVLAALRETNYRPNAAARTLVTGRSGVVGVVMHEEPATLFHDPYFSRLLEGMSDGLADQAAGMMLWLGNRTKEETLDHILGMGLMDGVIVSASQVEDPLVDGLLASDLPTVLVGHRRDDLTASYVDVDHVHAADQVTSHLLSLGRRRVGHITGGQNRITGQDRLEGYRRAMKRAGLLNDDLVVEGAFTYESGLAGAEALLDRKVDAMFCANDAMAEAAIERIQARGLRIPEDVAVSGFDDLDFAARLHPPLTTIRQGVRQQGKEAARVLFALLKDPERGPRRVLLPTELVVRQSTVGGGLTQS